EIRPAKAVRAGAGNVNPANLVVSPSVKQVTFGRRVRRYRCCRSRPSLDRGRDNEHAQDDLLVVLVRRLGAISRETFEPAIRRLYGESAGGCSNALDRATTLSRFSRRRISRADEFPAIGRAAGQGIAPFPGEVGQPPGQRLIAAQP